jgi:hypothetical protein
MRRLIALVATVILVACAGCRDTTAPPPFTVVGEYQLKKVNGATLPVFAVNGNATTELTADHFSVDADGSWSEITSYTITIGESVIVTQGSSVGVYAALNGQVKFTQTSPPGNNPFSGSVVGDTLTILVLGTSYVYSR